MIGQNTAACSSMPTRDTVTDAEAGFRSAPWRPPTLNALRQAIFRNSISRLQKIRERVFLQAR